MLILWPWCWRRVCRGEGLPGSESHPYSSRCWTTCKCPWAYLGAWGQHSWPGRAANSRSHHPVWHPAFENSTLLNNACWCAGQVSLTLPRPVGTVRFFCLSGSILGLSNPSWLCLGSWDRKGLETRKQSDRPGYRPYSNHIFAAFAGVLSSSRESLFFLALLRSGGHILGGASAGRGWNVVQCDTSISRV